MSHLQLKQVKEKRKEHATFLKQRMVLDRKITKERAKVDDKVNTVPPSVPALLYVSRASLLLLRSLATPSPQGLLVSGKVT